MRFLILSALSLIIVGCTDSNKTETTTLNSQIRELKLDLSSCISRLETYYTPSIPEPETSVPEVPAEPECEDVEAFDIYKDGKFIATCEDIEDTTCGLTASNCKDEFKYFCLSNTKVKATTIKKCN